MKKRLSIVGLGWFGMELAKTLKNEYHVFGTKRSIDPKERVVPIFPLTFTPEPEGTPLSEIFHTDLLVLNIPPNARHENAESDYRLMMDYIVSAAGESTIRRAIFVSSTGVFGGNNGIVDEKTTPVPTTIGGRILMEAEQRFLSISSCETVVLRPAGLVGGDRHPIKFLAGRNGVSGRLNPVNLVQRDDLISMTAAILSSDDLTSQVFHAAASGHPSKEEYYSKIAKKLNLEIPHFDLQDSSEGKEIKAERSKQELGIRFNFEDPFAMI